MPDEKTVLTIAQAQQKARDATDHDELNLALWALEDAAKRRAAEELYDLLPDSMVSYARQYVEKMKGEPSRTTAIAAAVRAAFEKALSIIDSEVTEWDHLETAVQALSAAHKRILAAKAAL